MFDSDELVSHRLGFFPNPDLMEFQNDYDIYLDDEIYADMIDPRIVITPLRFDFYSREDVVKNVVHPASHLTIGQYKNCRIPVTRPLMPVQFVSFIIRNFYNNAFRRYEDKLTVSGKMFPKTITPEETRVLHVSVE